MKNQREYMEKLRRDRQEYREEIRREKEKKKQEANESEFMTQDKTHITPGPGSYNVTYRLVEDSAPSYTLKGKLESGLFDMKDDYDDPTKALGLEGNLSAINQKLPDFNLVKETFPRFIMPKSDRFNSTLTSNMQGVHSYEREFEAISLNNNKNKKL